MPRTILHKVLPNRLKSSIKETLRHEVESHIERIRRDGTDVKPNPRTAGVDVETTLRVVMADLDRRGYVEAYWPHQPGSASYMIPKHPGTTADKCLFHESSPLPLPPKDLWVGYGNTPEEFLALGQRDIGAMREMIEQTGLSLRATGRILDFGCATGRMIRWLHDVSDSCEIWGVDISSTWVIWCKQYLSPPFHFATTTTTPHLPFEDRYFGLIYAGSIFTHIDDLADAWFMELRRILRPGGRLYITVHDQATIATAQEWPETHWLKRFLHDCPEYHHYCRDEFGMFTIGRSVVCTLVFYDVDYLCRTLKPFFRPLMVQVGAYGHQTGVLFERV